MRLRNDLGAPHPNQEFYPTHLTHKGPTITKPQFNSFQGPLHPPARQPSNFLSPPKIFEPPFTKNFSDADLQNLIEAPLDLQVPANTQHVEHLVRTITKIGTRAVTTKKRDGFTRATLKSRKRFQCVKRNHNSQKLKIIFDPIYIQ